MRKLQRVQNAVLKELIQKGSWTYYGYGNAYMAGWMYRNEYERTYGIMLRLQKKGIVNCELKRGTRYEVFTPAEDASKYLRKELVS